MTNSIVINGDNGLANLTDSACYQTTVTSHGHNIDGDNSCNLIQPSDLPATDPLLAPLPTGISRNPSPAHNPLAGSPAIDAGDNTVCQAAPISGVDQHGLPRADGACDIGAIEVQMP